MALLPEEGGSPLAADASRFRLFDGVTRLLGVAAGADGMIVVLDDLQWADEASLRLLGFAARGLLDESVVIVGTYRDDEIGPDHPLSAVAAELAGRLRHLQLSGLDADELAAFVRSQPAGDGGLAAEQVADLHRVTGGNPFFAREVLALVGGQRSRTSVQVPAGVRAVIERRLARLSHACDDALEGGRGDRHIVLRRSGRRRDRPRSGRRARFARGGAGSPRCRGRGPRSRSDAVRSRSVAGDGVRVDSSGCSGPHACAGCGGIGATALWGRDVAGDGCPSPHRCAPAGRAGTGRWGRGERRRGGDGGARPRRGMRVVRARLVPDAIRRSR